MAIAGYRFSRVTIAAVFVFLSVIALITGCRIFSGGDDEGYYPQITATSMSGRILVSVDPAAIRPAKSAALRPADLAGYVGIANAEVWIEDLADNPKYHTRTNASGVYVINDVPPGPHRIVTRLENGGSTVMKNRSAAIEVADTPGLVPVPDMPLLVAKNVVTGQLRDADGNLLPENTVLTLWGEPFKVGKDGTFISPPLPEDFNSAEIQVQLPNGNGATSFSAPFVSDIVPVFVDLKVGGSQETGNHAPSVILQAAQVREIVNRVVPGSSVVLTAVGSDLDESDRAMLSITWEVTAGTLSNGSSDFEKNWKAPDYQTLATITVEVKDPKGAIGVARLPILVGINSPSQYDGARPSVTLDCEVTQVSDSAAFVVSIAFDEMVSGFALEDISLVNGTADNFRTITAGRAYSVRVKPQAAGAVTIAVGENVARDVAGNGNRASNVVTVTNKISPVLSSAKALTAFSFSNPAAVGTIDETGKTVSVTVPFGTDVSALIAKFTVSAKATVKVAADKQVSGTNANDFSSPVVYQVIAEDGSSANYTVTVTVTGPTLVSALDLSSLVTAPVKGAVPVTTAINQVQYTSGAISWYEADGTTPLVGKFAAAKVYVARLTLAAKAGYTLTGVAVNSFTYTGATSVANAANSGAVTITFAATSFEPLVSIAATSGTPQSGQTLTAGALTPADATVDYKWQVSNDGSAGWVDVAGATGNTYVVDLAKTGTGKYVRVVATGKNNFSGTVNSTATQINTTPVTTIAATTGTPQSGQTLTAGALTPAGATVGYKWQVSNDGSAGWVDIAGATGNTYVVDLAKTGTGKYVRVVATGKTNYSGTVNSSATQISATPVTAIAAITGTPQSGQTLTAGALTPAGATVDYKWQVSNDGSAGWVDIAGATGNTYVVDLAKTGTGKYVRVVATGKTNFSGTVNSAATQIGATPVTAIAAITGTPQSGQTLTAGALTPTDATVDYKWQVSNDGSAGWVDIAGATGNTYVIDLAKTGTGKYVRVVATGKTNFSGTVNSAATQIGATPVTAITATTGTPQSGQTLTAGALTSADATVDYKWQVSNDGSSGWVDIAGATGNTYVVDLAKTGTGKYVRVVATGKTNFSGTVNSAATQIGATPVTAIAATSGTPQSGQTLTAGALTPAGATVDYKWQVSDDGSAGWVDIVGATANIYVVDLAKTATGKCVRVVATGKTNFSGTVNSAATQIGATPVTAIAATTGTPQSGQTLTAGALTPNDATVDYKWQVSDNGTDGWADVAGATANTYVVDLAKTAVGKYVRVVATGKTNFSGTVNSAATQIGATPVTAIAAASGTPQSGQTLTAGALTPNDATVDYKWQVSDNGTDGWADVAGATANTYVVDLAKTAVGKYVRVVATGKANFSGTVNSTATQIGATPVTAIAATSGTPQSGQTLTAGALTPADATVDYKWQVSDNGTDGWVDVVGATANPYVVDLAKTAVGKYVRVVATGKTNFSGTVNSAATQIGATPVTAIAATSGTPQSGQTLTAGALTPNDATVDYKWQVSDDGSAGWADVVGATANTYVVDLAKTAVGKYVRVVATGKTSFSGTVNSAATQIGATPVTAIAATSGTPQSGQTLTAGALTPADATVDYKWQVSDDGSAGWADIVGATANTYVVDLAKTAVGKYVRVVATGKTNFSGTVNSVATQIGATPVTAIAATTGTPQSGQTLTAGALTPADATVDYKWQVSDDGSAGWVDIVGATANTYVVDLAKTAVGKYVRVVATGKTNFSGTVNSSATQIGATPVTAMAATSGTPQSGQTLTAGALTPNDATVDYKWQVSDDGSAGWADVAGATANTYVVDLAKTAIGKYVRVVATGKTNFSGTVNSAATQISVTPVTAIGAIAGIPISGQTLSAGALTPVAATADYKWQVSADGSTGWVDIAGAAANTYVVDLAKTAVGKYVRVAATGNGSYGATVNSAAVKIVTSVTAIGAVSGVPMGGQTLTAGALTPAGATADYKWQVSNDGSTGWADVDGATANTYVVDLAKTTVGKYVRAVATGNGNFGGVVNSAAEKIQGMPTMVSVPAGTFQRDATPANTSFVSAFSMSAHEITRAQFARFMGTDPTNTTYSSGVADPVQMTTWYHAIAFCNKLSIAEGLTPVYAVSGIDFSTLTYAAIPTTSNATWNAATCNWSANGYRLPTEMEWMWAAMGAPADGQSGGTNTSGYSKAFAGSDGGNSLDAYAWYSTNSSSKTHPAGTKLANELGLYDMSGNVWEWCWDWYLDNGTWPNYAITGSYTDYRGAVIGSSRVTRGGCFINSADYVPVAYRSRPFPYSQNYIIGFRVARSVITPLTAIGAVSGTPKSGQTLTAGALTPGYAAVNYQWQVSDNGSSGWSNISGETANTYVVNLTKTASGKYVRVAATGKDSYSGTVYSSAMQIWGDYSSANIGTLKYVPAGTFQRDATPENTSAVSGFRMAQHEVTRTQFSTIMSTDPANTTYSSGVTDPVQMTNWYHAIAFCNKLSIAEGLTPVYAISGVDFSTLTYATIPTTSNATWDAATCNWSANGYRLPTEMEWMWAGMGADQDSQPGAMIGGVNVTGYAKTFAGYNGSNSLDAYAWYSTNSSSKTHPAGTKSANELGLYDMSGNVYEWCWDWYDTYPAGSSSDYSGAGNGSYRVLRGGSCGSFSGEAPVAYRIYFSPSSQYDFLGFRVVRP